MNKNDGELNQKRGERLRYERKNKNMTQEQLAEYSNYSVQHISYIENGKRKMGYDAAHVFSGILGVSVNYLMCETDYKSSANNTSFDNKKLEFLFSNVFSLMFEYNYDLVGIIMADVGIDNTVACKSKEYKIELLSKICIGKKLSGAFYFELQKISETVKHFALIIRTPLGKTIKLSPDELCTCICNIIQYSQLQFLNLGQNYRDVFSELTPIYKSEQNDFFHNKGTEDNTISTMLDLEESKCELFSFYKQKKQ